MLCSNQLSYVAKWRALFARNEIVSTPLCKIFIHTIKRLDKCACCGRAFRAAWRIGQPPNQPSLMTKMIDSTISGVLSSRHLPVSSFTAVQVMKPKAMPLAIE
jgi:hypothetical protein